MSDRPIDREHLMICCVVSASEYDGPEVPGKTVIGCQFHDDPNKAAIRLNEAGVWEWVEPPGSDA